MMLFSVLTELAGPASRGRRAAGALCSLFSFLEMTAGVAMLADAAGVLRRAAVGADHGASLPSGGLLRVPPRPTA